MSKFPSYEEIKEIREKYKRDPKRLQQIKNLIEAVLDYNGKKIRKAAASGLTDYDLELIPTVAPTLRDLQISEPDLYRMIEAELRKRGYYTILSVHNEDTGEMFCDLMIGW